MLAFEIPKGTTPDTLLTQVLPKAHGEHVPASAPAGTFELAVELEGSGGEADYSLEVSGNRVTVTPGRRSEKPKLWLRVSRKTAERFVDDWSDEKRFLPTFAPRDGVLVPTDPRVLARCAMVSGSIELALRDFEGGRASVVFGAAGSDRARRDAADPDVVVETDQKTFEDVLAGRLGPEAALANDSVSVKGKRLVALQFALAVAPFYPAS